MPKIIAVSGVSNTGKSEAIVAAMNRSGLHVGNTGKDALAAAFLPVKGQVYGMGFASSGDTKGIVDQAVKFFRGLNLDYMVFACRSYGGSYDSVEAYGKQLGIVPFFIHTQWVQPSGIRAHHQGIVQQILAQIP